MLTTSKRYVVNTDNLNSYKFRVLTAGIDLSQYKNNPVLLFMHQRPTGISRNEVLGLGNAIDLQFENDNRLTCRLSFDDKDDFAVSIYNKYESGVYNMLSPALIPLEETMDAKMMLPGQVGPTVTKSLLKEISCVDIGANPEAYACELYDRNGNLISLSDRYSRHSFGGGSQAGTELERLIATPWEVLFKSDGLQKLKDLSVDAYCNKFYEKFGKYPDNLKPTVKLSEPDKSGNDDFKNKMDNYLEASKQLDFAVQVGKITETLKSSLLTMAMAKGRYDLAVSIALSAPITPSLIKGKYHKYYIKLACMTWDEIERQPGGTRSFQKDCPDLYRVKFYEKHGRMPLEWKK